MREQMIILQVFDRAKVVRWNVAYGLNSTNKQNSERENVRYNLNHLLLNILAEVQILNV